MKTNEFRLLVLGACGKLAGHVIHELIRCFGTSSLVIADHDTDKLKQKASETERLYGSPISRRTISPDSNESLEQGFEGVDVVIVPFFHTRPLIQLICVEKGIICIDISSSENLIDLSYFLKRSAATNHSLLLMAAGFWPGLSGMIAKKLFKINPGGIIDIAILQDGKALGNGAGVKSLSGILNQKAEYIHNSSSKWYPGFSKKKFFYFENDIGYKEMRLSNFIERKYLAQKMQLQTNFWTAFSQESLNISISNARRLRLLNLMSRPVLHCIFKFLFIDNHSETEQTKTGLLGQIGASHKISLLMKSELETTAACMVAYIKVLIEKRIKPYGIFLPFEVFEYEELVPHLNHVIINAE